MEYFIITLIAVIWGWSEFVKSMRLNTIEAGVERDQDLDREKRPAVP